MNKFAIYADACCDLSQEIRDKYDIIYVKGHVTFPDGSQKEGVCSWDGFDKDAFYKDLRKNPNGYSTAPASPEEYKEAFEVALKNWQDILAISISTALSGTYNFMNQAKAELEKEYPDRKILIVDSLRFSTGFGLICVKASLLRSEGMSIDEVYGYVEANKYNYHQCGFLDDLSFVAAKGRISKAKAFMGQLVGIKPFGEFDKNGLTTVLGQVKGDKAAIKGFIEYIKATIENPEEQIIFVATTNRMKQALAFKEAIEAEIKPKEVVIAEVYIQDAVNVGPGLMCAYYYGKRITDDLAYERNLVQEIIKKL